MKANAVAPSNIVFIKYWGKDAFKIKEKVLGLRGINKVIVNYASLGARLVKGE